MDPSGDCGCHGGSMQQKVGPRASLGPLAFGTSGQRGQQWTCQCVPSVRSRDVIRADDIALTPVSSEISPCREASSGLNCETGCLDALVICRPLPFLRADGICRHQGLYRYVPVQMSRNYNWDKWFSMVSMMTLYMGCKALNSFQSFFISIMSLNPTN